MLFLCLKVLSAILLALLLLPVKIDTAVYFSLTRGRIMFGAKLNGLRVLRFEGFLAEDKLKLFLNGKRLQKETDETKKVERVNADQSENEKKAISKNHVASPRKKSKLKRSTLVALMKSTAYATDLKTFDGALSLGSEDSATTALAVGAINGAVNVLSGSVVALNNTEDVKNIKAIYAENGKASKQNEQRLHFVAYPSFGNETATLGARAIFKFYPLKFLSSLLFFSRTKNK